HHGARRWRAGGDRLPGRPASATAIRSGRPAARQLRRAGPAAHRRPAGALSAALRSGRRSAARLRRVRRLLRSADGAAQAEGRRPVRVHQPGEEESVVPAAHPQLAAVRARCAQAQGRAQGSAADPAQARAGAAVRIVAVLPFAVDGIDPQAHDLAHWVAGETAWELCGPAVDARLVVDPVEVSAASLGDAAGQLAADFALVATLSCAGERLTLQLLALTGEFPALAAASRALLHAAQRAIGGERMPALFAALECLAQARPDDPDVLIALGDYRALHLDEASARELYLRARDAAEDPRLASLACLRLASIAESADRSDEAIQHLRAAIRLADDARAHARLGTLLLAKDPAGAILALTRATVLAPDDAALHLALA